MLSGMFPMMRPLLISSILAAGRNRVTSCFMTSGKGRPVRPPKPLVEEEPSATIFSVWPAPSFAFVRGSGAPSDNPLLNRRQAAEGGAAEPWEKPCVPQTNSTGSKSKKARQQENIGGDETCGKKV